MEERDIKLESDRDFILSKRYNDSLRLILKDNPNGIPDRVICRILKISQEELEKIYNRAILSMRSKLIGEDCK